MKKYFLLILALYLVQINAEIKLEDCASIKSDIKRLACYDYLTTGVTKTSDELAIKDSNSSAGQTLKFISDEQASFGLSSKQKKDANIEIIKSHLVA